MERGELAYRVAAVHTLVVWAGQLSTGGTGMAALVKPVLA
jgi:hypothetical protein